MGSNNINLVQVLTSSNDYYALSLITLRNDMFAVAYHYGQIEIWNSSSLNLIKTLQNNIDQVWALGMLSNGNLVSANCDPKGGNFSIKIWYITTFDLENVNWNTHLDII
jgi:hypothetical protein